MPQTNLFWRTMRPAEGFYTSEVEEPRRLPVRTSMCLLGDPGPKSIVLEAFAAGLVSGTGHDMLRVGPVKIFTDGSAGGRTAWMTQPYLGEDKTLGVQCQTDEVLDEYVMDYHRKGYQMDPGNLREELAIMRRDLVFEGTLASAARLAVSSS